MEARRASITSELDSIAARRKSAWKRVTSIYTPSSRTKDLDDSLDIWDNNDDDFQRQVALESNSSNRSSTYTQTSSYAYIDDASSAAALPIDHAASNLRKRESLPVSTSYTSYSPALDAGSSYSLSSAAFASPNATWHPTSLTRAQRPASATGTSIFGSPFYSGMSSETGSALTVPSPGPSVTEVRKWNQANMPPLRTHDYDASVSDAKRSLESSPTRHASDGKSLPRHPSLESTLPRANVVQVGQWTQEPISPTTTNPPASTLSQSKKVMTSSSLDAAKRRSQERSTLQNRMADNSRTSGQFNTLEPPIQLTSSQSAHSVPTAAERVRMGALASRSKQSLISSHRDVRTISSASGLDTASLAASASSEAKAQHLTNQKGLFANLKKKLLVRPNPVMSPSPTDYKNAGNERSASSLSGTFSQRTDPSPSKTDFGNDASEGSTLFDYPLRRPSAPGIAQQSPSALGLHAEAAFDAVQTSDDEGEIKNDHWNSASPRSANHTGIPDEVFRISKELKDDSRATSKNDVPRRKRQSNVGTHSRQSSAASRDISAAWQARSVQDEVRSGPHNFEHANRTSSLSRHATPVRSPPQRPVRREDDPVLERSSSLVDRSASDSRMSFESAFNAAHDRRWSTVGQASMQHVRRGSDASSLTGFVGNAIRRSSDANRSARLPYDSLGLRTRQGSRTSLAYARPAVPDTHKIDLMASQRALPSAQMISQSSMAPEQLPMQDLFKSPPRPSAGEDEASKVSKSKATSRISRLLLGRKRSVADLIISRPGQPDDSDGMAEDPFADRTVIPYSQMATSATEHSRGGDDYSPSSEAFSQQSRNPNRTSTGSAISLGASSENIDHTGLGFSDSEMRPSRSTNDLVYNRQRNNLRSASSSNLTLGAHKRPTFGLDLQPDAAAAFDSIPLPDTPELRSRSRTSLIHPSTISPSEKELTLLHLTSPEKTDEASNEPFKLAASTQTSASRSLEVPDLPTDLPSDVEESEDLLDAAVMSDTSTVRRPSELSRAALAAFGSPSNDEVELLEDEESASASTTTPREAHPSPIIVQPSISDSDTDAIRATPAEGEQREEEANSAARISSDLQSYRFPATKSSASLSSASRDRGQNRSAEYEAAAREVSTIFSLSSQQQPSRTSIHSDTCSPVPVVAAHLHRPSSSTSFV